MLSVNFFALAYTTSTAASTIKSATTVNRLGVNGTSLTYGAQRVFLASASQPYQNYGSDFGDNLPAE